MPQNWVKFLVESVLLAVGMGLVSTAVWAVGALVIRRRRNRRDFGLLAGRFRERAKYAETAADGARELTIEVSGNVLTVRFTLLPLGQNFLEGEIAMSEGFRRSGSGHYYHDKGGPELWGFWTLTVRDKNTLMLHSEYANKSKQIIAEGKVWERIPE